MRSPEQKLVGKLLMDSLRTWGKSASTPAMQLAIAEWGDVIERELAAAEKPAAVNFARAKKEEAGDE